MQQSSRLPPGLLREMHEVLVVGEFQDDAGCSDGEKSTIGDDAALLVAEDLIVDKRTRIAGTIAQHIFKVAVLVARDVNDAMGHVDAGVIGLNRTVDAGAFHITANDVVAQLQGYHLLVVEHILNDDYASVALVLIDVLRALFLAGGAQAAYSILIPKVLPHDGHWNTNF